MMLRVLDVRVDCISTVAAGIERRLLHDSRSKFVLSLEVPRNNAMIIFIFRSRAAERTYQEYSSAANATASTSPEPSTC